MSKNMLVALGVVVLLLAGGAGYYFYSSNAGAGAGLAGADAVQPDDHVMGKADAPVTMIEYFAQGCSVCAAFDHDVFPLLKAKYIDTGKVRYVMRLFPLFAVDGPAYKLTNCLPPDRFFQATDFLFKNQPQWDSAEFPTVPDAHAGLIKMARILGLSAEQADACMNSTKLDAHINKVAQDATTYYQPGGTPTLVIDFKKADIGFSWEAVQGAIDAALKEKGVK